MTKDAAIWMLAKTQCKYKNTTAPQQKVSANRSLLVTVTGAPMQRKTDVRIAL